MYKISLAGIKTLFEFYNSYSTKDGGVLEYFRFKIFLFYIILININSNMNNVRWQYESKISKMKSLIQDMLQPSILLLAWSLPIIMISFFSNISKVFCLFDFGHSCNSLKHVTKNTTTKNNYK